MSGNKSSDNLFIFKGNCTPVASYNNSYSMYCANCNLKLTEPCVISLAYDEWQIPKIFNYITNY